MTYYKGRWLTDEELTQVAIANICRRKLNERLMYGSISAILMASTVVMLVYGLGM